MPTNTTPDAADSTPADLESSTSTPERPTEDLPSDGELRASDYQSLDRRSVGLHRLVNGLTFAVIGCLVLLIGCIVIAFAPFPAQAIVPLVWIATAGCGVVSIVWWPRWQHGRWSYRVGERVLELHYGVIWHVAVAIPLTRLQHIDLHRGPLERRNGLASLQIHTAGTRDASHRIPGLDLKTAHELRDQLIAACNRASDERAQN